MFAKKDCVICAAVCYLMLIFLFVYYQKEPNFSYVCSYASACIRFCCRDKITCNDTFIRDNFNISGQFAISDYKVMLGEPKCSKKLVESDRKWIFLSVKDMNSF